jgi:small conductance mechanosensitive channel
MEVDVDMNTLVELAIFWGGRLVAAIMILIAGWVIGKWVSGRICKIQRLDTTICSFLGGFAKYAVFAVSIVAVLGQFGVETASLLAVLGAAGLAIGLALKGTLSNIAAGTMILLLRPFNLGDYITFGQTGGTVISLGLFGTELVTPDNVYVFAPNSKIWGSEITNYSRNDQRRQDLAVGISYDSDIDKAMEVIHGVLAEDERLLRTEGKEPIVKVTNMGDSSVDMIVRVWTDRADFFAAQWDLKKKIKEALDNSGITIPFPTRTLEISNPQALPGNAQNGEEEQRAA